MNIRIRRKLHKVIDLCLDAKEFGHDCFFKYMAHVKSFELDVSKNGWRKGEKSDIHIGIYLDEDYAEAELDKMIEYLETLIDESVFGKKENSKENTDKVQEYRDQFSLIQECKNDEVRTLQLRDLMTEMEGIFKIPLLQDEKYNHANAEAMDLYLEISNARIF